MTNFEKQNLIKKLYDFKVTCMLGDIEKDGFIGISGVFYSVANLFNQLGFGGRWMSTLGFCLWKQNELHQEAEKEINEQFK